MEKPVSSYRSLLKELGPQGWWPVAEKGRPAYHKGDYSYPRNEEQQWEICVGALLVQNTNWRNVERALGQLRGAGVVQAEDVLRIKKETLAQLVRPSGYYNQKAVSLKALASAVQAGGGVNRFLKTVSRDSLLKVRGIGPETGDSILLYAGKRPFFVVDAYTRRVFGFPATASYEEIQAYFEKNLPRDWRVYNEFHALIVEKGKNL